HARLKVSSKLDVDIESFEAGTALTRVRASGHMGRVGVLHPDLKLDVELGLRDVQQVVEGLPALEGRVTLAGRLREPAATIEIDSPLEGPALRLAGWPVDRASGRVTYSSAGEGHAVVDMALSGFGGEGHTDLTFVGTKVQGRMQFKGVDAARLARQGVSL